MRRTFFHIDEFGSQGFGQFPHIACLSDPLVLWAPSGRLLAQARARKQTDLTEVDLLRLIDRADAPVRVIARPWWYFDLDRRRGHPYKPARWQRDFGDVLARIAEEDQRVDSRGKALVPPEKRRVLLAAEEKGFNQADKIMASLPKVQRLSLQRKIRAMFHAGSLPRGFMEKAERLRSMRRPYTRVIMRDMINHDRAIGEALAASCFAPSEHILVLRKLVPGLRCQGIGQNANGREPASGEAIKEAVRILKQLAPVVDRKRLQKFLRSNLRRDLIDLLRSPDSRGLIQREIVRKLQDSIELPTYWERIAPDPIRGTLWFAGALVQIASAALGAGPWGFIPVTFSYLHHEGQKHSVLPLSVSRRNKLRSLFFVSLGTRRPRKDQIKRLLESFEQNE